ncbi:RagB/SusD family nutrient uptake outer membrane protein [Siphonobacter sp. BAB-5385]|uniref:RagB/SusD family nutrient uptake outer membrane protein n=3 Tax=unclassified Siphonobacter TaxID=2635712 RepID=UPI001C3E4634|nr:RagB/SusD family nutrient uptake outer membrane protein [Siphonobacter sp. BAB-5385]
METEPRDWIRDELVWDDQDRLATVAQFNLNDLYNYLPSGFNRIGSGPGDFLDAATDDAIPSRNNRVVRFYANGFINPINNPDPYWANSYAGIRRANIFLANIDKVPATAQSILTWKSEARFIRAMLYAELLKRYGGIPLVGDRIFTISDDLSLPRNTYRECLEYIVSECDALKSTLRQEPISDTEWGRIPRGAALALKARVLLYAASPLFNGGASSELTGFTTTDVSRWQRALDANQELIDLKYYALQTSFNNIFTVKKNAEVILAKQSGNSTSLESWNAPIGYGTPAASQGVTSPTQNLVDAFPMDNGLAITDPTSGYDPTNPYINRDSRFDLTVFYNGKRWLQRAVETFDGGRDRPGGNLVQTQTGYYLRKFMADFANNTSYTNQSHNFIYFRYAETLLNQAEILNELGRTQEAVDALMLIRKRAAIKPGTNSRYGIKAGISKDELRALIQNERRIELAFEEHRFWDVRRWKLAETLFNQPLRGMRITQVSSGRFSYTPTQVTTISFQPRLYLMPLPYEEITKNLNLLQNPGW